MIWLIFVDDLHVDFLSTGRLRGLLKTISSELIHEGDMFGTRSSGPSSLSIDVTSDRKLLEVAIVKTYGNALSLSDILPLTNGAVNSNEVRVRATLALSQGPPLTRHDLCHRSARLGRCADDGPECG